MGQIHLSSSWRGVFRDRHGAWGGGWEWREVARSLRANGHEALTPTLTGLGERARLGNPSVGLATHIADVCAVLEVEALDGVVCARTATEGCPSPGLRIASLNGSHFAPIAARAREAGWHYRELDAPHDPQLIDPAGLAVILEELAASGRLGAPD